MKIRIKYEKNKEVKYLGHLDTITMFDRAFRRSNIDIKFSNGFNKRACFVFALPTSTGIESKSEYMEFGIENEEVNLNEIKEKLNSVLPNGFKITDIKIINDNKSIMAKVIESEYEIDIKLINKEIDNDLKQILDIFNEKEIEVVKKSKDKKISYIDIKPYILDINIKNISNDIIRINVKSKAGSRANLRPDYIINAIENNNIQVIDYNILRKNLILDE